VEIIPHSIIVTNVCQPTQCMTSGGEHIEPQALVTFDAWHNAVNGAMNGGATEAAKELMRSRVAKKCKFYPPTYHTAWEGRDEFLLLIECVSEVFGQSFTYGRQV
jgi:hypothetical protein